VSTEHPQDQITVVLADDHTLFREGLREMLVTDPAIVIAGEATDGYAAVKLAIERRPDILLLDVEMPGPGASRVIRAVHQNCPDVDIIVLTMHDDADIMQNLLKCRATAYLIKSVLRSDLIAAIHSIARRPDSVLVSVSRQTFDQMDVNRNTKANSLLTKREIEVLELTAEALSNAQIGSRLKITEATVKRHLTNIYAKLNATSRIDAIRKATKANLIGSYAAEA
jgi:DNA-binding NarL/FixJ family response regulator